MFVLSLPHENLCQVFHHLDCREILSARLTCWRLYAISKSRILWQSKALEVSYSSGVPLLEEPIENYTQEELEEKIITRALTSQKWHKLDPARFQWRNIELEYPPLTPNKLQWLPGGRWLLINCGGCVGTMDLDAPELVQEPLFDVSDPVDPLHLPAIWIDPTKCWLSPRMALQSWDTGNHKDSSRICIYQLNSTGHGSNMKWRAEEIAIIRTSARGLKGGLQLEKEYVLEGCTHQNESGYIWKAYLYKYSDGQLRSCKWDYETKSMSLVLLPKSRISVFTQTHLKISVIKPVGSDGLELQPVFCTLLDSVPQPRRVFKLHSALNYSYFNIGSEESMLEIQFPHDANEVYQKRVTFSPGPISSAKEGPSLLVRPLHDNSMDFISYKLEEGATRQVASQICIYGDAFRDYSALEGCDVTSGRLLIKRRHRELALLQV